MDTQKAKNIYQLSKIATSLGFTCHSVDYTDIDDPDERAQRLENYINEQQINTMVLVGSSMGGYVSLVNAEKTNTNIVGVFLMAPAVYITRYQQQSFQQLDCPVEIVHGWQDDVVLYEHSIRYARETDATLHLMKDNHRLSENPEQLKILFSNFLTSLPS